MTGADSSPPPRARALRWTLALLAVHGVVFAISELSVPYAEKGAWRRLYEAGGFFPLQIASMAALLIAARRAALPEGARRALRFIGIAFGMIALGSVVWLLMEARGTPLFYISWADLIYFQFYPFLILGLWALPKAERSSDLRQDTIGWMVVVIVFGSLIGFAASVDAQSRVLSTWLRAMAMVTSAAQLATLMMINRAVERARRLPSSLALTLLLGALALSAVSDLVFQVLFSTGYVGRNWSVIAAIGSNLMIVGAAIRYIEDPIPGPEVDDAPRITFSPLPIIAVTSLALTLVWMAGRATITGLTPLLIGLVLVNALLVIREARASRTAAEVARAGAVRDATRRVEALVRHSSDAILLLDGEGRLLFASAPADRLFGAPLSAREGRTIEDALPEPDRNPWLAFIAELLVQGARPVTFTFRLLRAPDDARMIECVGLDLRAEPAVRGLVVHSRDITDRALLEERLRQSQKLEVAGRLAGGVAHDFNNVLTAVIAGAELAQMSLEPGHPAMQDLSGVEAAAQRGAALTRRLLAFVRQEPVPAQSVDLRAMLLELEPLLGRLAGEANQVTVEVPEVLGTVLVDRTELEHIIFNLVANSRDASPMGGAIAVRATLETVAVPPDGAVIPPPPGVHAVLSVADHGHGMPEEVRRRMFDPFFTQKSGGRGTGLGLIGVRPLIEGAKGGLAVQSSPTAGTRVVLYLPCVAEGIAPPPRHGSPTRTTAAGASVGAARILLVEDELPVREQLIRLLDALGYASVAVPSAAEARAMLEADATRIDAVVSDVMMPGESGIEFGEWLRRAHPKLPILLISGHTGTALDRVARSSGDFDLLRKPFSSAELNDRLAVMLMSRPAAKGNGAPG